MKKNTRNMLIFSIITLLIFAIIFIWYQEFKTEPINTNTTSQNVLNDANTGLDNILNNILENEENVENVENIEDKNTQNKEENNETEVNEKEYDSQMTSKENKAVNLAKKEWKKDWGTLDDVSFNVSVRDDGKYLVTVYDIATTQLIQGYIVDVDAETIKER